MQTQKILPSRTVTVVHCLAGLEALSNAGTLSVGRVAMAREYLGSKRLDDGL